MTIKIKLAELFAWFSIEKDHSHALIQSVATDSRIKTENGLYVPIVGEKFDGHAFVEEAMVNGAIAALWKKGTPIPDKCKEKMTFILVDDTLEAIQHLASCYLKQIGPKVIGITGSNGKTTTKDILFQVMTTTFRTHKTKGNLNNHLGVPLTILTMDPQTEVLIVEMGMSDFGEIEVLSRICSPDLAIITNIGESHIQQLKSREGIARAKMEIAKGLKESGWLLVDGDEPLLNRKEKECIKIGFGDQVSRKIKVIQKEKQGVTFLYETNLYSFQLLGDHNIKNACYAIEAGLQLGVDVTSIQKALLDVSLTEMRMERKTGLHNAQYIIDCYNASPTSMKAAIQTIKNMDEYEQKLLVLGDMYELGDKEKELHESVAEVIDDAIDQVIAVGEKAKWIADAVVRKEMKKPVVCWFKEKDEAKKWVEQNLSSSSVVLFKASRGLKLETVIPQ